MKHFVQGYAFSSDMTRVVMMRKLRPPPIAGKLAGTGGGVEPEDKDIFVTMAREHEEETSAKSLPDDWSYLGYIVVHNGKEMCHVAILCAFGDHLLDAKTTTDEEVFVMNVQELLNRQDVVPEFPNIVAKSFDPLFIKQSHAAYSKPYLLEE